jgi:hypothetical protein
MINGPITDMCANITGAPLRRQRHHIVNRQQYIDIDSKVLAKTYVKLAEIGCGSDQFLVNGNCVYIQIKRKGSDAVIARYNAFDLDVDGAVGFYWDDCLFCVAPGYYIGEIFIDCGCGCSCDCEHEKIAALNLVKRRTRVFVGEVRGVAPAEYCPPPCPDKQCCDGAVPSSM